MSHTFAHNNNFSLSGLKFGPDTIGDLSMGRSTFAENFIYTMSDIWSSTLLCKLCSPKDKCIGLDFSKEYVSKNGYLKLFEDFEGLKRYYSKRGIDSRISDFLYSNISGYWENYTPEQISLIIEISGHLPQVYDEYEISGYSFKKPVPFGQEHWWFNGMKDVEYKLLQPSCSIAQGEWTIVNPFIEKDDPIWQWGWSMWDWTDQVSVEQYEDTIRDFLLGYPYSHTYYDFSKMICDHSVKHNGFKNVPVLPYLILNEKDLFSISSSGLSDFSTDKWYNYLDTNLMAYSNILSIGLDYDYNEQGSLCVVNAISVCGLPSVQISSTHPYKWSWLLKPTLLSNGDIQDESKFKMPLRFIREQIQSEALIANDALSSDSLGVSRHTWTCPHQTKHVGGMLIYDLSANWEKEGRSSNSCDVVVNSRYVNSTTTWNQDAFRETNLMLAFREREKWSAKFSSFGSEHWWKKFGDVSGWCTTHIDLQTGRATILIHYDPLGLSSLFPEKIEEYYKALKGILMQSTEEQRRADLTALMEWYEAECSRISSELSSKQEDLSSTLLSAEDRKVDLSGFAISSTITNYYSNGPMVQITSWNDYKTYWYYDPMVGGRDMPDGYFPDSTTTKLDRNYIFLNEISYAIRSLIYDADPSFWNNYSTEWWYSLTSEGDVDYLVEVIESNYRTSDMETLLNICTNAILQCYMTTYSLTSLTSHQDISDFISYQEYWWPMPFSTYLTSSYDTYILTDQQYLDLLLSCLQICSEIEELEDEKISVDLKYQDDYLSIMMKEYDLHYPEYNVVSCMVAQYAESGPRQFTLTLTCTTDVDVAVPADSSNGLVPDGFEDVFPNSAFPANDFLSSDLDCIDQALLRFACQWEKTTSGDQSKGEELSVDEDKFIKAILQHDLIYPVQSDLMNQEIYDRACNTGISYHGNDKDLFAGQVPLSFIDNAKGTLLTTLVASHDMMHTDLMYEEFWESEQPLFVDVSCDNGDFWESQAVKMHWIDTETELPLGDSWLNVNAGDFNYDNGEWEYGKTYLSTGLVHKVFTVPDELQPPDLSAIDYCVDSDQHMYVKEATYQFQTVDFLNLITRT